MDIQVIVPIFNAYEVTHNLIKSLLQHNQDDAVVLINDASTDSRIQSLFENLPSCWIVLENSTNLGFVKTANLGLQLSTENSILLNSDTLVSKGWLDRFIDVIKNVNDLGTATPWSNNAEICSIPETLQNNPIPERLEELSIQLANKHKPQYPELPTAVGFCMLVTAAAKTQVGYFDENRFGLGYGEENDYSLRVKSAGLRNVLVDNCYVAHVGNQSFKERSLKPNQDTMDRLLEKHPQYLSLVQKFIENDPLKQLRQSIIAKIAAF